HGFHLELDRPLDEQFQVSHIARLLIEQPVDHRLGCQHHIAAGLIGPGFAHDLAEYLVADAFRSALDAAPRAAWTGLAENLLQAFAGALAGHLHQPQLGDADDVGLGVITLQLPLQRAQYLSAVFLILHVDEVDDDDATQVAQP